VSGAKRLGGAVLGLATVGLLAPVLGGETRADAAEHVNHAAGRVSHAAGHAGHAAGDAGHRASAHATTAHAASPVASLPAAPARGTAPAGAGNPVGGAAARIGTVLRAAGTRRNPGRLLVTATEFRLALSRPAVDRGVVVVELLVAGEDPHDLALQRLDRRGRPTGRTLRIPRVTPDGLGEGEFRLARGTWRLTCTLPGHARMGMKATLRVR
jgi:hypothetical protein